MITAAKQGLQTSSRTMSTEVYVAASNASMQHGCTDATPSHVGAATATMAPAKKGWRTEEERDAAGLSRIQSFFKPIKKRGRPRKRKKGNLASDEVLISKPPPSNAEPMKRPTKKVVATRTNWGKGEPLERILTQRPSRSGMIRLADTGTPMERPVQCECSRLWSASLMTHSRSMLPPV